MKKIIVSALAAAIVATLLPIAFMIASAEKDPPENEIIAINEADDEIAVTYGFLKTYMEQFKQELAEELSSQGGINVGSQYKEISAKEGQVILLSPNCELIYRGGGAVAITSDCKENQGITDMSLQKELFSGEELIYGHIYYASASPSKKAVMITGGSAYFTVRGDYEIA